LRDVATVVNQTFCYVLHSNNVQGVHKTR